MTTRKRIRTENPVGSGGGGAPPTTASLAWGPDFGESGDDNTFTAGVALLPIDTLSLENTKTVGVDLDLTALDVTYNEQTVGVDLEFEVALENDKSVGVNLLMDELSLENEKSVGVQVTLPELAMENEKSVGCHLSGEALGAPFWQSVANAATTGLGGVDMLTVNRPTGTVDGDLLLAFQTGVGTAGQVEPSPPAGWTQIDSTRSTGNLRCKVYRKIASSEPSTYDFTWAANIDRGAVEIHRVNGVDTTTPIDVTNGGTASVTDPVVPAVTTTVANTLVFAFVAHLHTITQSHSPPASHVERDEVEGSGSLGEVSSSSYTRVFSATGSTGTATVDCNQVVASNAAYFRIAVAPGTLIMAA